LGVKESDRDMLYPAKDWREAIQRILNSGWYVTLWAKPSENSRWTVIIHSEADYPSSTERYGDYALESEGGITEAIMRAYKKWRDSQLEGDENEE